MVRKNFSLWSAQVSASTLSSSRSASIEQTARTRASIATVSVPMPGPTSSTTSSHPRSASSTIRPMTSSFTRKFCPRRCFVASPKRSSTARVSRMFASLE